MYPLRHLAMGDIGLKLQGKRAGQKGNKIRESTDTHKKEVDGRNVYIN